MEKGGIYLTYISKLKIKANSRSLSPSRDLGLKKKTKTDDQKRKDAVSQNPYQRTSDWTYLSPVTTFEPITVFRGREIRF